MKENKMEKYLITPELKEFYETMHKMRQVVLPMLLEDIGKTMKTCLDAAAEAKNEGEKEEAQFHFGFLAGLMVMLDVKGEQK